MEYNKYQQPTGPHAKDFPAVVTTLIRTKQFPLKYTDWRDVPVEHKEKLIDDLSAIYLMDDCLMTHSLQTAAKKWRSFKADMKSKAFKTDDPLQIFTKDELLGRRDKRIDPEKWRSLVEYWLSERGQQSSERGKHSRSMVVTPHTNGSKSFARAGYEWAKEHGYEPSRYELFMKTHTKKNGVPLDKALPKITELTNKAKDHPELLEVPIEKGDVFSHVFGRDPRGYVRGVGLGPTPASLGIDGHRKCTSTSLQMANRRSQKAEEQNTILMNALGILFDEVRDLREKVDGGQGHEVTVDDDVADRVSAPIPEHGSNHTPAMTRGAANERSDHDLHEDAISNPHVEVIMPSRGRALLQPTRRHDGGGKEVILLSVERPRDRPVAKATLQTTNPEARVGGSLLGGEYHEVVVNSVIKGSHVLPSQHGKLKTLADCVGQSIAWPHLNIVNEERAAKPSKVQHLQQGGR